MRVLGWRYDSGEPIYMSAINSYSDARRPGWRCSVIFDDPTEEGLYNLKQWFHENYTKDQYDLIYRFNNGNPFMAVEIYDELTATVFKLRWA